MRNPKFGIRTALAAGLFLCLGCDPAAPAAPASPPAPAPKVAPAAPEPQEAPPLRGTLTIERDEERFWSYRFRATTELPDETLLAVHLNYVSVDREGTEEANAVWHNGSAVRALARVSKGALDVRLGRYPREPYPVHYRAVVIYQPEAQDEAVATAHPKPFEVPVDLKEAAPEVMKERLDRMTAETVADFDAVEGLFNDVKAKVTAIQAGTLSAEAWGVWKHRLLDQLDELRAVNANRFEIWTIWTERSGKLKLEGLHLQLADLVAEGSEILGLAGAEREERLAAAKRSMDLFLRTYHADRLSLGLEKPPSPEARAEFARVRAEIEAMVKEVEAGATDTLLERSLGLTPRWILIAEQMPVTLQEPVQAAVRATAEWTAAAAAGRPLEGPRAAMDKALSELKKALGE